MQEIMAASPLWGLTFINHLFEVILRQASSLLRCYLRKWTSKLFRAQFPVFTTGMRIRMRIGRFLLRFRYAVSDLETFKIGAICAVFVRPKTRKSLIHRRTPSFPSWTFSTQSI